MYLHLNDWTYFFRTVLIYSFKLCQASSWIQQIHVKCLPFPSQSKEMDAFFHSSQNNKWKTVSGLKSFYSFIRLIYKIILYYIYSYIMKSITLLARRRRKLNIKTNFNVFLYQIQLRHCLTYSCATVRKLRSSEIKSGMTYTSNY